MKDPKNAVKTLQFLLTDYPQTPFREVAEQTLRGSAIQTVQTAAQAATQNSEPTTASSSTAPPREVAAIDNIRFFDEERPCVSLSISQET
jgi:hypothetical protein